MALKQVIGLFIAGGALAVFLAYYFSIEDETSFWKELGIIGIVAGFIAAIALGVYLITC